MTPEQLALAIRAVLAEAVDAGDLAVTVPDEVRVERPRNREHGDYATNVALQLAKGAGRPPREVAEPARRAARVQVDGHQGRGRRRAGLPQHPARRRRARASWRARSSRPARRTAAHDADAGQRINLEFVSANPTGPIHIGGVRWAAVGDALARLLAGQRRRGRPASTTSTTTARRSTGSPARCSPRAKGEPAPEDGYGGAYIDEIARGVLAERARTSSTLPDDEAQEVFRARASS